MECAIEVTDLGKSYEDFALTDVSFAVRRGSITGLFGPNGAGKSTLIKVLAQQAPFARGSVRVLGLNPAANESAVRNRVGYVPQEPVFYQHHAVRWNARFGAAYFERWDPVGFNRLLERFRINPLQEVKHLSGGQKNLLSMAFALSHEAELLVLDEPTAGLDVVFRRDLLRRLRQFVAGGDRTVVVASHITDGLDDLAEDVVFLDGGRVVLRADREDLLSRWKWVHFRDGALDRAAVAGLRNVHTHAFGNRGLTPDVGTLREALAEPLARGEAKIDNASLEDVLVAHIEEV